MKGLEQALRELGKVALSEMGDAESDAIRAVIVSIQGAQEQLDCAVKTRQ